MKPIFLHIFSFGITYLIAKKRAKKKLATYNTQLTISNKIPFELTSFYKAIGNKQNLIESKATINSIKLVVKDINLVDQALLKQLGAKGVLVANDQITCLMGDYAKTLDELIRNDKNNLS